MGRFWMRGAAVMAALGLAVAGCGDDGGSGSAAGSNAGATTTASGASGSLGVAGDSCTLPRSLSIVGLAEKPPEGPNALVDFANGWELAVKEINDKGGVCGKPIKFDRLPVSPTDNNAAKASFLSARDRDADAIAGVPNNATVLALAPEVAKAATPMLYLAAAPQAFVGVEGSVGSEWGFIMRPRNTGAAAIQAAYLVEELGKKKVGLLCANQAFGEQGCKAATDAIQKAGGSVVASVTAEITATNMTTQVLALKNAGAEGVLAFQFPNAVVVFLNQAAENGLNVPIFAGATAALAMQTGNVSAAAVKNAWGLDDCVPASDSRATAFAAAYKKAYGSAPNYAGAEAYDSIHLIADAVRRAGSLDKAKIAAQIRTTSLKGACDDYQADAQQGLHHSSYVESFNADGTPVVKKAVPVPAPAK